MEDAFGLQGDAAQFDGAKPCSICELRRAAFAPAQCRLEATPGIEPG